MCHSQQIKNLHRNLQDNDNDDSGDGGEDNDNYDTDDRGSESNHGGSNGYRSDINHNDAAATVGAW